MKMRVSFIVAMDLDGVIGQDGALPWRLPNDMKNFKRVTMGKPVIMGRKTHESIGRPLPGRKNIVMTRDDDYVAEGCEVVHSVGQALRAAGDVDEVMVAGGASVYRALMDRCDRIYLTTVTDRFTGDVHFPDLDLKEWRETQHDEHDPDDSNAFRHTIVVLERERPA